jgi:cell division protein FtsL
VAAGATLLAPGESLERGQTRGWGGATPEVYFAKNIDNSRLVKLADGRRNREMAMFTAAVVVLFVLVMGYAWQHFRAIEDGYRIEAMKAERDSLAELGRALRLEEASLRDPQRIDVLARRMGLASPEVGQVMRLQPLTAEPEGPVLARAGGVAVVSVAR